MRPIVAILFYLAFYKNYDHLKIPFESNPVSTSTMLARACMRRFATMGAPPPQPPQQQPPSWFRMMSATTVGILLAELIMKVDVKKV